ncbi:hypothetical protein [Reichenbachiella versicolor]|uniref:hypothetical protein n=1 Tax=Reichenbachiella versicolor TaxID=1821036 RepID=UPI001C88A1D5|nr:hypothetical protein [Reichenbachiella versicolor]
MQVPYEFIVGSLIFFGLFMLCSVAYYIDSLHLFYYRKVNFRIDDLEISYWYKWKLFTSNSSPFFVWRKIKFKNHMTNQESEHIMQPVSEKEHILYFYLDNNYKTYTGVLFDAVVVRDADVSMGFDLYSTDYLGKNYVYERRKESTEYLGMIERGKFYKTEGMYRNVNSKELNY